MWERLSGTVGYAEPGILAVSLDRRHSRTSRVRRGSTPRRNDGSETRLGTTMQVTTSSCAPAVP
jgi:hypothetical protein